MRPALICLFVSLTTAVAQAADDAHGGGEPAGLFDGTPAQSVAAIVVFAILLVVLWKFAWGPILTGLQDREQKIKEDLEQADAANAKAKATLVDYETKLTEAHADVRKMLDQARTDADAARAKMIAEAEEDVARLRSRATDEIRLAQQQAVQDLYAHAADLATAVAGKMLGRQVDDADTQRLIDESLDEMGKAG